MAADEAPKARRRFGTRQALWATAAAVLAATLILSGMTVRNYTEVVKAKVLTEAVTIETPELTYDAFGALEAVSIRLELTITNPSAKELKAWIFTYKAWARDLETEQGAATGRLLQDGEVDVNGTEMLFFPVFVATFSFDNPQMPVPPHSNITISRSVNLTRSQDPAGVAELESILDYAGSAGLELEWLHYSSVLLMITDIPPYSGMNNDANLIRRFEGADITPGSGGL